MMEQLAKRVHSLPVSDIELDLLYFFRKHKCRSVQIKRANPNYYELTLEERKRFLGAPSTYHLCKTIILENTNWNKEFQDEPLYYKHVAVIIQYEARLNSEKIMKFMKELQNKHAKNKHVSKKHFHFRLADEEVAKEITGYGYNAITPFLMKQSIPVILSEEITHLTPKYFWMGGGEVELKLGMSVEEFLNLTGAMVAQTS